MNNTTIIANKATDINIKIFHDNACGWSVLCDRRYASRLTVDEAMFLVNKIMIEGDKFKGHQWFKPIYELKEAHDFFELYKDEFYD